MTAHTIAKTAGYEALQHRQPLAPLLEASLKLLGTKAGNDLLGGLFEVMCEVFDSCQAKGITFEWNNDRAKQVAEALPHARRLLMIALCQRGDQAEADVLASLSSAVYGVRDRVTVTAGKAAAPVEPPVTLVQIVGMPDRAIQTSVDRDLKGAIVGSAGTERDA